MNFNFEICRISGNYYNCELCPEENAECEYMIKKRETKKQMLERSKNDREQLFNLFGNFFQIINNN